VGAFDRRKPIFELRDPLVHLRFEMCQPAQQFGFHHQFDFCTRVRDASLDVAEAPLDFVKPPIVAAQQINDLKQHRSMLIRVGADLPKDREHQTVVGFRHVISLNGGRISRRQSAFRFVPSIFAGDRIATR
jgi:hypothetical protein